MSDQLPRTPADVVIHPHADALVDGAARRLLERLEQLQRGGRTAQWCLTGGRIATRIYQRMAELVGESGVDPSRVELWWCDERFVPTDDPDRNAGQALGILAGQLRIDSALAHPIPAADGQVTLEDAALTYASELGDTVFDVCLLGMGPDGHVASLFPGHPSAASTSATVIGVTDSPKPPSNRITLTLPVLNRSGEVWFLVSGEDKAEAVGRALAGDPQLPASHVRGTQATVWLLDADSAGTAQ